MAGLPNNNTYIKSETTQVPTIPKAPVSGIEKAKAGNAEMRSRLEAMMNTQNSGQQTNRANIDLPGLSGVFPSNVSLKPSYDKPAVAPGLQYSTGEEPASQNLAESGYTADFGYSNPGANAVVRTSQGIGQYVLDGDQPGEIMRSARIDESEASWQSLKEQALDGRPGYLYNVDHAVPLWLGGTNNAANLQVLTRPEHAKKTKAESVALTLYANKAITRDEAFYYATTWQNRDLTDVPAPQQDPDMEAGQTGGQMALSEAIKIRDKWKAQESAVPKLSFMETVKALIPTPTNLSKGGKRVAASIDEKTDSWNPFVQGVTKGLTTGLSFGAVRYTPEQNDKGGLETAGNITGNILGMLAPVSLMGKVYGKVLGVGAQRTATAEGLKTLGILKGTQAVGSAASTGMTATVSGVNTATQLAKAKLFKTSMNPQNAAMIKAMTDNFIKWTPAVATYGQAQVTFDENPERGLRFMEDIFFGGITGYASPTLRGAGKAAIASGLASLMMDGASDNRPVSFENALINGLTIGALHGMSAKGVQQQAQEIMLNESAVTANNLIGLYLPRVKRVAVDGVPQKYTLEEVSQIETELRETLMKQVGGSADGKTATNLSDEAFEQQQQLLGSAIDTLRFRAMPEGPQLDAAISQRLQTWANVANDSTKIDSVFGGTAPKSAAGIVEKMPQDLWDTSIPFTQSVNFPSGTMRTTGLAENFTADPEVMGVFVARRAQGNVSPTLVAISRPERTVFNRILSEDPKTVWKDSNPENTLQVFARSINENGEVEILNVGYVPQTSRIEGGKYSFNSQKEIVEGKFPGYDVNVNKDSVNERMNEEGIDYLFLTLDEAGFLGQNPSAGITGDQTRPFLTFKLGDDNWTRSIEWQKTGGGNVSPTVATDGLDTVLQRVNTTKNAEVKTAATNEYVNNFPEPAYTVLDNEADLVMKGADTGGIPQAQNILESSAVALDSQSPAELQSKIQELFNIRLNEGESNLLFEKRYTTTAEDMFGLIEKRGDPLVREIYRSEIKPNLDHLKAGEEWEYRNVFLKMRVLAKQKPAPVLDTEISPAIAKKTVEVSPNKETVSAEVPRETVEVGAPKETVSVAPEAPTVEVNAPKGSIAVKPAMDAKTARTSAFLVKAAPQVVPDMVKPVTQVVPSTTVTPAAVEVSKNIPARVVEAVSIVVPEGGPRTNRQQVVDQMTDTTVKEGQSIMKNIRHTTRLGDSQYAKALRGAVDNVDLPVNPRNPVAGGESLKQYEKAAVVADATYELRRYAAELYQNKVPAESTVRFKFPTANKEDIAQMAMVQEAIDNQILGFKNAIDEVRANIGEEFDPIYKQLTGNEYTDSVDKKPKAVSDKQIGVQNTKPGDLLGDDLRTFKTPDGKEVTYSQSNIDARRRSGKTNLEQTVLRPLETGKKGSYMHTFATTLNQAYTKKYGKDWINNPDLQDVFSDIGNKSVWTDALKKSEGEATQPLAYLRELGKGRRGEAKKVQEQRRQQVDDAKMAEQNRRSQQNIDDETDVISGGGFTETGKGQLFDINEGPQLGTAEKLTESSGAQSFDDNVPAPAMIDRIMAGFTTSMTQGIEPTPEHAMNDAIQFLFKSGIGFNSTEANTITQSIIKDLNSAGIRLSNAKDPMKKSGQYFADAQSALKQANTLLTGSALKRFQKLAVSDPRIMNIQSVKNAKDTKDKMAAVWRYLKREIPEWEQGMKTQKGWDKRITPESLQFFETYNKYDALKLEALDANRAKEIMKADSNLMKSLKKQSPTE